MRRWPASWAGNCGAGCGASPPGLQPYLWGYVGASFITLGVAYGTWQAWWLAGHAGTALILTLIMRQAALKDECRVSRITVAGADTLSDAASSI